MSRKENQKTKLKLLIVPKCINDLMETRTISVRTIEAQTVQKLKNNDARTKYTGSSKTTCILIHADTLKRDLYQAGGD